MGMELGDAPVIDTNAAAGNPRATAASSARRGLMLWLVALDFIEEGVF